MALIGSHQFGDIDGQRVTYVEKGTTKERVEFLTALLKHNNFEVIIAEDKRKSEEEPQLYTVAVTDMVFNPTVWVYQRRLRTLDRRIVSPAYWNQEDEDTKPQYWEYMK